MKMTLILASFALFAIATFAGDSKDELTAKLRAEIRTSAAAATPQPSPDRIAQLKGICAISDDHLQKSLATMDRLLNQGAFGASADDAKQALGPDKVKRIQAAIKAYNGGK